MQVIFPFEGESWTSFIARLQQSKKSLIVILSGQHDTNLLQEEKQCQRCLQLISKRSQKTYVATHNHTLQLLAAARGIEVIKTSKHLKQLLKGHDQYNEAIREFLPQVWRQHLRSRLQNMGLLSLPKIRVWSLVFLSVITFMFALFKLLPGAEIIIVPRQETVTQTTNIFLVQSGASLQEIPSKVRIIDLVPIRVRLSKTITFNNISKKFLGTNSRIDMQVINNSSERYSLRAKSRVQNNAGIIFLLRDPINIAPGETVVVAADAAEVDMYNEIIGERGNVPKGLRWDFIGLSQSEKVSVYAENITDGTGGETSHTLVYSEADLAIAESFLQQSLLSDANQQIDEEIEVQNSLYNSVLTRLFYDDLRTIHFSDFDLSRQYLGQTIDSVPLTGTIEYTAYAYDKQYVLQILEQEIHQHVEAGKKIVKDSISFDLLSTHVMEYSDNLSWIKITVDLSASERFVLDSLTPNGIKFANKVRAAALGKTKEEARRVINNMPEVERATVRLWPPWSSSLPDIAYNISITADE